MARTECSSFEEVDTTSRYVVAMSEGVSEDVSEAMVKRRGRRILFLLMAIDFLFFIGLQCKQPDFGLNLPLQPQLIRYYSCFE